MAIFMTLLFSLGLFAADFPDARRNNIYDILADASEPVVFLKQPDLTNSSFVRQNDQKTAKQGGLHTEGLTICVGIGLLNKSTGSATLIHADVRTEIEEWIADYYQKNVSKGDLVEAVLVGSHASFSYSRSAIFRAYKALTTHGIDVLYHKFNGELSINGQIKFEGSQNLMIDIENQKFYLY